MIGFVVAGIGGALMGYHTEDISWTGITYEYPYYDIGSALLVFSVLLVIIGIAYAMVDPEGTTKGALKGSKGIGELPWPLARRII